MTRTANKGSLRAGATARRKKHAQRTPLPGDTSQPVIGNPTADLAVEFVAATRKPRKAAMKPPRDTRAFGEATEELAARAKALVDEGKLQREVAEILGLAEGKTGTGQVRRLLEVARGAAPAPRKTARKAAAKPAAKPEAEDKPERPTRSRTRSSSLDSDGGVPMQTAIGLYHLHARDTRKGRKNTRMAPVNVGPIGDQQVRSLQRLFESDGYTVTIEGHAPHSACCGTAKRASA